MLQPFLAPAGSTTGEEPRLVEVFLEALQVGRETIQLRRFVESTLLPFEVCERGHGIGRHGTQAKCPTDAVPRPGNAAGIHPQRARQFHKQGGGDRFGSASLLKELDSFVARGIAHAPQAPQLPRGIVGKQLEQLVQAPQLFLGVRVVCRKFQPQLPHLLMVGKTAFRL